MHALDLEDTRDRHLGRMLQLQAEQNGDGQFLITDQQRINFADAEDITNRLATAFQSMGISRGDRVAFFLGSCPQMVLMCLALNKIGAVWVPVCTDYRGEWLSDTLKRSRAKLLVTDIEYQDWVAAIASDLDYQSYILVDGDADSLSPAVRYEQLLEQPPLEVDYTQHNYGDTCAILWTSGTTGRSKGVMQAHNNWVRATVLGTMRMYHSEPGDIIYCALPLYNSGAWVTCVLRALATGLACVIEKKFSASGFMDRIKHFGATQTFAVGAMGIFLLGQAEQADDADNPLREAAIIPMPPNLWSVFENRFGVRLISSGLGQSECLLTLNQLHSELKLPVYALGYPPPDAEVDLFNDEGVPVADGESGEICVRPLAPYVLFNGYFDDPEATAAAYRGEWFLTGDLGRRDPQTRAFFFVDRKKDAVRFAGRNISTMEVESVVRRHPAIGDVAAFGIPSDVLASEDELKLSIVIRSDQSVTAEELCWYIEENAPHYFVPRYIDFVTELPYTPTNKVQKYILRQRGNGEDTWDRQAANFQSKLKS